MSNIMFCCNRDPFYLDIIVKYMIDGNKSVVSKLDEEQLKQLVVELDFYCMDIPKEISSALTPPAKSPLMKWIRDERYGGPVDISNGDMTVKNTSSGYARVYGDVISNRFTVRVDNRGATGEMSIGFYRKDAVRGSSDVRYYFLRVSDGNVESDIGGDVDNRPYTTRVITGDVITVIREGTSISFKKNGISLGEAFTNIPGAEELHPFVEFWQSNQQITSVDEPSNTSTTI